MFRQIFAVVTLVACSWFLCGCATAPKSTESKKSLEDEAAATIAEAQKTSPEMQKFMTAAYGYAVFPSVGKGGAVVGGAYGKGILYQQGQESGYCDLSQATVGLQLGGQKYSEIICFENAAAQDKFKSGNFAFSAQATAVALKTGAAANAKYTDGVAVFTLAEEGLMAEAAIGGQKFSYQPKQ
jgi:lipid-binding SYLF domain-containing protein